MPGAFIHTRITWDLSPMATQVLGVIVGSPLCQCAYGVASIPHEEVRDIGGLIEPWDDLEHND